MNVKRLVEGNRGKMSLKSAQAFGFCAAGPFGLTGDCTSRYKDHIYFCVLILVCPPCQDLVKSHLMYAVREEVEVLKEHIKELYERNSMLERENAVLKSLANSEQLSHLTNQLTHGSRSPPLQQQHPLVTNSTPSLVHHEGSQSVPHQPDITSA